MYYKMYLMSLRHEKHLPADDTAMGRHPANYDPRSHAYLSMGGGPSPQLSSLFTSSTMLRLIASNTNGNFPQKRWLLGGHTFPSLVAPYGADLYLKLLSQC